MKDDYLDCSRKVAGGYRVGAVLGGDPSLEPSESPQRSSRPIDKRVGMVVKQYGDLLGPGESLRDESRQLVEKRTRLSRTWEVRQAWRHDVDVVAKLYRERDGERQILALTDVFLEPALRAEGDCLDIGARELRLVGDGQSAVAYCVVMCPSHGADVCKVGLPGDPASLELAWNRFDRIGRFVAERVATEYRAHSDCLAVWCPAGDHKVVVWLAGDERRGRARLEPRPPLRGRE